MCPTQSNVWPPRKSGAGPGLACHCSSSSGTMWHFALSMSGLQYTLMMMQFLPAYTPFLNPIEEFFSAWRWKYYDHRPYEQMPLLNATTAASQEIGAEKCQGWIRHARRFFPRCIAREECDMDEALWPHRQDRRD